MDARINARTRKVSARKTHCNPAPDTAGGEDRTPAHHASFSDLVKGFQLLQIRELGKFDFTRQEFIVAKHLLSDDTQAAIAEQMYLSVNTIKFHTRHVYAKAHVTSRQEFKNLIYRNMLR